MTLADRLLQHCSPENRSEGYGALVGATYPLLNIVDSLDGQPIRIDAGVDLRFPEGCEWHSTELSDGSVQLMFTNSRPVLTIERGLLRIYPTLASVVLRLGAADFQVQATLKLGFVPLPRFTLVVPLGGRRAGAS